MWSYNQGHYGQCRPVRLPQCTVPPSTCPRSCKPGTSYAPSCNAEKNYRWPCSSKLEARRSCSAPPRKRLTIEFTGPDSNKRTSRTPRRPRSVCLEPTVTKLNVEKRTAAKIPKRDIQNKQPQSKTQRAQPTRKIESPKVDNSKSSTTQTNQSLALIQSKNVQDVPVNSSDEGEVGEDDEECGVDASSQTSESSENKGISDRDESCDEEKCGMQRSSGENVTSSGEKKHFCDAKTCGVEPKNNDTESAKGSEKVEFADDVVPRNFKTAETPPIKNGDTSRTPSIKSSEKGERVRYCANERCGMDDGSPEIESNGSNQKINASPVDIVEDHEYLHFLLAITEDILRNNRYTNKGMDEVFESHLQANRGRLDEARMKDEIERLKIELNYPLEKNSAQSVCHCDKEVTEELLESCKCCPGYANESCACVNPECPGKKLQVQLNLANKADTEVPPLIQLERQFYSVSQYENISRQSDAGDIKRNSASPEEAKESDENCIDPTNCSVPAANISKKSDSDKRKAACGEDREKAMSVACSTVKIVNNDDKDKLSQIVYYNSQVGEICHCTATLRKTALKIQVDEQDQEYILVDGPICMPKSMLEEKTIPVLIENVSSMSINSEMDMDADHRPSNEPSFSRMNLYVPRELYGEEDFVESVSFEIREATRKKTKEADYDMTPEREMVLEPEEEQRRPIVQSAPKTKNIQKECNLASVERKDEKTEDGLDESNASPDQSVVKNGGTGVDPQSGVIKYTNATPWEMESKVPSLFELTEGQYPGYEGVDRDIMDKIFGSQFSEISEYSDSKEASRATSKSNSAEVCGNKRCPSRESSKVKSEGEISDDQSDSSVQEAEEPTRAKSNSSERQKSCCSGSRPPTMTVPVSGAVVGTTKVDERPSQRRGSDFENKYHYLLQDASTSMTSADFRRASDVYEVPLLAPAPAPPISLYSEPRESLGDSAFYERKPSYPMEEEYLVPPLAPMHPVRTSISHGSSKISSSDTDDVSGDKRYTPKVFEYSTRLNPIKAAEAPVPIRGKPFEYAYPRKRGSVSESSDQISRSFSKPSDEVDSLLPPTYEVVSKASLNSSSDTDQIEDRTSSDQLKMSDTSIPRKDYKVKYTAPDETEPYDHEEIIKKLDEIPEQDYKYNQQNTVKAITDKLEEFRTIDRNDNARRLKYVNPEENFEIRRASLDDERPDDNIRNAPKPKPTCCGLGQKARRPR